MRLLITLFILFSMFNCKEKQSKKTETKQILSEQFWKNRSIMDTINQKEKFPIVKDSQIDEERTNRVYISSGQCQFEVFVNDVIVIKVMGEITKSGGGITGSHDINQLMLTSGSHEIKVRMYPMHGLAVFDENAPITKFTFSHFKNRDLRTKKYFEDMNGYNGIELSTFDKQWIEKYDEASETAYDGEFQPKKPIQFKGMPFYEWRKTFHAEVPFDHIGWRASLNLKDVYEKNEDELELELYRIYKDIHAIIKSKDTNAYLNLIKEREELVTSCLYYKANEKQLRANEFVKLIKSDEYELLPLIKEVSKLEYQGYGNLVMLLNKLDGEGVIRLKNKKDPDDNIYLDFKFHKKTKEGPLSII